MTNKVAKRLLIILTVFMFSISVLSPAVSAAEFTPYSQGFGSGINENQMGSGFFKDAIYPLEGDFDAATYSGHQGYGAIDLTKGYQTYGQPIYAVKSGTVTTAQNGCDDNGYIGNFCNGGYGNNVVIDHGQGYQTQYAHMRPGSMTVRPGQHVETGDIIGYIGTSGNTSGPHLHFEVRENNRSVPVTNYFYIPNVDFVG